MSDYSPGWYVVAAWPLVVWAFVVSILFLVWFRPRYSKPPIRSTAITASRWTAFGSLALAIGVVTRILPGGPEPRLISSLDAVRSLVALLCLDIAMSYWVRLRRIAVKLHEAEHAEPPTRKVAADTPSL